jgi:D-beta-D-heptose 7-phosphate kinase/D-beta-D-heptose 1-phosphate adenosyltransferase
MIEVSRQCDDGVPAVVEPRLDQLIERLRSCRIAVIGDVMIDRYVKGHSDRISPEAPIQVLDVIDEYEMLGGAANVTMKVVELGSSVSVVGLIGGDPPAVQLRAHLAGHPGIGDRLVVDPARFTTVKTRFIARNQQVLRVDRELRRPPVGEALDRLAEAAWEAARAAEAVILVDYGKGVLCPRVIAAALEGARASAAPVVVDPHGFDYSRYAGATVLTPNLKEAELASQRSIVDSATLAEVGALLVDQTRATLAITRGADGISLFERPKHGDKPEHLHLPTWPVAVHDVTGAGDAVAAVLAIALASNITMADACTLANLAGRSVVGQFGVGNISIGHLQAELRQESIDPRGKVVDLARASQTARTIRETGRRVVFTNGCFDILHQGHAHLLRFARSQGDFLILGLNSDASVKRSKGPKRPFVPEEQRSFMLSLYPFIDLIVPFHEDTPIELITAIKPDVLVKGGDYTPETVVGRELVESYGGRVSICPRLEGLSTTALAEGMAVR